MKRRLGALLVAIIGTSTAAAQQGPSKWRVESGPDGQLEILRDPYGNWSTYRRSDDGRKWIHTHYRNGAGHWQEIFLFDQGGERVVEVVRPHASGIADHVGVLRLFGLAPGKPIPATSIAWESNDDPTRFVALSPFGKFEHVDLGGADGVERRETTTVLGRSLTVEVMSSDEGRLIQDDAGGWRAERYDDQERLVSARDEHGPIVRVERDELGRAVAYWLGQVGVLRFTYDGSSPQWTLKELIDLRDGHVIFRWETATPPGTIGPDAQSVKSSPGAAIRLFVPDHGTIAEWDPLLYPEGVMVARLGHFPYALVPLDGDLDVVRSLTLFEMRTARGWDRIDYTSNQIFVHMTTDAADSDTAEQTAVIVLPRRPADDDHRSIGSSSQRTTERSRQSAELEVAPCPDPNIGCTCYTWNSGTSISCPDGGDDGGGDPPLGGGTGGSGGGGSSGDDGGDGAGDGDGDGGGGSTLNGNPLRPEQLSKLRRAQPIAREALENRAGCSRLFADLHRKNGLAVLDLTTYRDWSDNSNCTGVPAFTIPNWLTVFLCRDFEDLPEHTAAAVLIHEALHSAGLLEKPQFEQATMTSSQIQDLVEAACNL